MTLPPSALVAFCGELTASEVSHLINGGREDSVVEEDLFENGCGVLKVVVHLEPLSVWAL